ncbi:MAG: hypothetical protein KQH63_10015 [Desulfobulbaceae bacterium]|nr:hypothetical protein [Desulfobulbaceae bacterium]
MKSKIFILVTLFCILCISATAEEISDFAKSKYVQDFNNELRDFWEEMIVFRDDQGNLFIRSRNTANWGKDNHKSINQNLFFGSNLTVYQIRSSGTSATLSGKRLLDLKFSARNYDLHGKMHDENTIELSCEQNLVLLNRITDDNAKKKLLSKIKFIPFFPKRVQWFYYKKYGVHRFIDSYRKNLIPGEVRYFEGKPGKMKYYKVKKVLAFDCDRNPIFVLESGKRVEIPEKISGVHRPHHLNGKKLGIPSDISTYPDLPESRDVEFNCKDILTL